jgi:acyl dehydratase
MTAPGGTTPARTPTPLDPARLGTTWSYDPFPIEPLRVRAYALATNDRNPAYLEGGQVPPVYGVVPVFAGLAAGVGQVVPEALRRYIVHGSHDMHFRRPLEIGMELRTAIDAYAYRVRGANTIFVERIQSSDTNGDLVLEQFSSFTIRGNADSSDAGPEPPAHTFPEGARERPVAEYTVPVDLDQSYRYAGASGDHSFLHIEERMAKAVGLPGIILQGICTLAMCSQAVVQTVAGGDPRRLRRLAVQFAGVVLPGGEIVTRMFDAGEAAEAPARHSYAFESTSGGAVVARHGRAEVLP